jgi:hypothetical protein
MPNRYEREIEEILRNMEATETKPGPGQRFSGRLRRKPDPRKRPQRRGLPSFKFKSTEWFIIIAVAMALISGGYAYANNGLQTEVTGILVIIGTICLLLVVLSPFLQRSRQSSQSFNYGNVTPIRRNPLNSIVTRWNLFMLKLRYRRKNGRNGP